MERILYSIGILGILGLVFGFLLGYASKKFEVEVDARIPKIKECLPGANCGGCGYPGCQAFATAIVEENVDVSLCSVAGDGAIKAISKIMGIEIKTVERKNAYIMCKGDCSKRNITTDLTSLSNCNEAKALVKNNGQGCSYGCLGLGLCINVCKFNALKIENGIAQVIRDKCVNCGACIKVCPMGLIEAISPSKVVRVACSSRDIGKVVRANCKVGCIGCKICEKSCPSSAISVVENLARIDYEKCTNCGVCAEKCPTKAIKVEVEAKV